MMIQTHAIPSGHTQQIGELQAALAANASMNSWVEAQGIQATEAIALGETTDGSPAMFED